MILSVKYKVGWKRGMNEWGEWLVTEIVGHRTKCVERKQQFESQPPVNTEEKSVVWMSAATMPVNESSD